MAYPWIVKTTGVINQFYFYCVETDFGPYGATAHRNNARQGDDPDEVHPLPTGGDGTRNGDGNCSGIFHDDL